jgi:AbrB family looped-hinge helix DNA binding protein
MVTDVKNFNIVKLDSKGRLLVPYHIRELFDLDDGDEFVIITNSNREIKMLPLVKGNSAELTLQVEDSPGSLAKITRTLAKFNASIILSQLKVIERGHLAEWHAFLDLTDSKNFRKMIAELNATKFVKSVECREK